MRAGVRKGGKEKGEEEVDSVTFELSHIKEPTRVLAVRASLDEDHGAGRLCGRIIGIGRISRNEEYQPDSSLNR